MLAAYVEGERAWLVLDGPVDPVWAEHLDTLIDTSCTLTLPDGERLTLSDGCKVKVVFEVDSIGNASPATVSRNGIVQLSDHLLGWRPVVEVGCISSHLI